MKCTVSTTYSLHGLSELMGIFLSQLCWVFLVCTNAHFPVIQLPLLQLRTELAGEPLPMASDWTKGYADLTESQWPPGHRDCNMLENITQTHETMGSSRQIQVLATARPAPNCKICSKSLPENGTVEVRDSARRASMKQGSDLRWDTRLLQS